MSEDCDHDGVHEVHAGLESGEGLDSKILINDKFVSHGFEMKMFAVL